VPFLGLFGVGLLSTEVSAPSSPIVGPDKAPAQARGGSSSSSGTRRGQPSQPLSFERSHTTSGELDSLDRLFP